ncbi:MAG: NDP-sugar synthase [Planctomycetota bacterium]
MEAVLLATGPWDRFGILTRRTPPPLLSVANVPVLGQHLAACRCAGVSVVHLFVAEDHRAFREVLGEGRRWGIRLVMHRLSGPEAVTSRLRSLSGGRERRLLVLRDDTLLMPDAVRAHLAGVDQDETRGSAIEDGEAWGILSLPTEALERLGGGDARSALAEIWESSGRGVPPESHPQDCRVFRSGEDLLRLNLESCEELPWLGMGQATREGVFVQSNVQIDPTARLVPPVLIGRNAHVGAGVVLGPRAVVGEDCCLGDRAVLHDCLVLSRTYVGNGCEVRDAVVDGCGIYHRRHGAELVLPRLTLLADVELESRTGRLVPRRHRPRS